MTEHLARVSEEPAPAEHAQSGAASKHQQRSPVAPTTLSASIVQAKLSVGPANDLYEREADAVASRVVQAFRTPRPAATPDLERPSRVRRASHTPNAVHSEHSTVPPVQRIQRAAKPGSNEVIQRKLLFNDTWYGKGDEADLSNARLGRNRRLPGWDTQQLESEQRFYVLNESETEWVKDERVDFTRFPTKDPGSKVVAKAGVSSTPVDNPAAANERVLPKNPQKKTVKKATLIKEKGKQDKQDEWHWTLECEVEGGKKQKVLSMDLVMHSHRAYYGEGTNVARDDDTERYERVPFTLNGEGVSVAAVYAAMIAVAKADGGWTLGTMGYNCQDFVLALLRELDVQETKELDTEAEWRDDEKQSAELNHEFLSSKIVL